jgi:hypothetical protein
MTIVELMKKDNTVFVRSGNRRLFVNYHGEFEVIEMVYRKKYPLAILTTKDEEQAVKLLIAGQ